MATAFDKHTYGHTTMGFERDIAAMPTMYDYSRTFFARYYRPENIVLFVAGDVTPEQRAAARREVLRRLEARLRRRRRFPMEPEQTAERRVDVQYDGQTLPILAVAYKVPAFDAGRPHARRGASCSPSSRSARRATAYRRLVLDEQVVEYLDAERRRSTATRACSTITTRVKDPAKIDYVLGVIDATIAAVPRARRPTPRGSRRCSSGSSTAS